MPATIATGTSPRNGPPDQSRSGPDRKGLQTFGAAFHAARTEQPEAAALLGVLAADRNVPVVARATALGELAPFVSSANIGAARSGLADLDPMVRIGALDMLENVPPDQIWPLVSPLARRPVRGVRIRAVSLLSSIPTASQPPPDRASFDQAANEFIAAQRSNAERPEARASLGNFLAKRGQTSDAEAEYRAALTLSPQYVAAAINLADLYRQLGRDSDGETVLRAAIAASPRDAATHHALGLTLTRLEAIRRRARRIAQGDRTGARPFPVRLCLRVALIRAGRDKAMAVLKETLKNHPNDRDILSALVSYSRSAGDVNAALGYAERLTVITPGVPPAPR